MPLYAGQHADIQIHEPGERADELVAQLLEIVRTSAPTTTDENTGRVRVHLTQTDADTGAESIRKLAAGIDADWATLITIMPIREMP